MHKLGLTAPTYDPRDLRFAAYRSAEPLPKRPRSFGHDRVIAYDAWDMLGNDTAGDCVFAGLAHLVMLWNAVRGRTVVFSNESVLSDYSALTGYDPADPATDVGTDLREALVYARKVGVLDAAGKRHKIAGFVSLIPGDVSQAAEAAWLFGGILPGFDLPASAEKQFDAGHPWSLVRGSPSLGGHCVPIVGLHGVGTFAPVGEFLGIGLDLAGLTWGRDIPITQGWYRERNTQSFAAFSDEVLDDAGLSPEHFNARQLAADLSAQNWTALDR